MEPPLSGVFTFSVQSPPYNCIYVFTVLAAVESSINVLFFFFFFVGKGDSFSSN